MAEYKNTTETWELVTPTPLNARFNSYEAVMEYVEQLRELGDKDYLPTHLVRVTDIEERQEQVIALAEPAGITVDDVFPLVRERLIKLGGTPPNGEEALHWAVTQALEVQRGLTK